MKRCRQFEYTVCGRVGDERTINAPGSEVRKCVECKHDIRVHPSTLEAKIKAPMICLECAEAKMGLSDEEMEEQGTRLPV
jgi:hypothetical protein